MLTAPWWFAARPCDRSGGRTCPEVGGYHRGRGPAGRSTEAALAGIAGTGDDVDINDEVQVDVENVQEDWLVCQ